MRINELTPVFVESIPDKIETGKLYISEQYGGSMHLCPCGCGEHIYLPFQRGAHDQRSYKWGYTKKDGLVTFNPSIKNNNCPNVAHYWIKQNKIQWG